jgi:hypothetical protein
MAMRCKMVITRKMRGIIMSPMRVCNETIIQNLFLEVVVGKEFFDSMLKQYGKNGWNAFCDRLECYHANSPIPQSLPGRDVSHGCIPVCAIICLDGEDFSNRDLKDLDLRIASMCYCNFDNAHLGGSRLGCVEGSSFAKANLTYARCNHADISGCDFSEARLAGCDFERASYMVDDPPLHLPKMYMDHCSKFPEHWKQWPDPEFVASANTLTVLGADLKCAWGTNDSDSDYLNTIS